MPLTMTAVLMMIDQQMVEVANQLKSSQAEAATNKEKLQRMTEQFERVGQQSEKLQAEVDAMSGALQRSQQETADLRSQLTITNSEVEAQVSSGTFLVLGFPQDRVLRVWRKCVAICAPYQHCKPLVRRSCTIAHTA